MSKKTFLHRYLELNEGTEIPDLFALWCGISVLSAVLKRNVVLDMGVYKVFPNLYTVLVAGSGRCRKSTAIGIAESILYSMKNRPTIVAQKVTPEGLIDVLKREKIETGGGTLKKKSVGFVIADELSTFLNKKTYELGLAPLLIQFFDCKDHFEYVTRGKGTEKIRRSCLGLLSGSTVDWIRNAIPEEAIGGGLTSRMIFVYVEKPAPPVAITYFDEDKDRLQKELIQEVEEIAKVKGKMIVTPDGLRLFKRIYDDFYNKSPFYDDHILAGYAARRNVHLLKLALILAASEKLDKIESRHIDTAEAALIRIEGSLDRVMGLIVMSEKGSMTEVVYKRIASTNMISRSALMSGLSRRIDKWELDNILATLKTSNRIEVLNDGNSVLYKARN